jgi:ComF family protein
MINKQSDILLLESYCFLCGDRSLNNSLICGPCWLDLTIEQPACYRCGRSIVHGELCSRCLRGPDVIDSTLTLFAYQFPATALLRALKYKNQLLLANELGRRLADKILNQNEALPGLIIPVPLHPRRLLGRGYNQALEISRSISARLAVPLDYQSSKRARNTLPQFNLSHAERRRNIRGAFKICSTALSGSIAIVDDIVTTGHTANELAKQLKRAGAEKVNLWACAHAG